MSIYFSAPPPPLKSRKRKLSHRESHCQETLYHLKHKRFSVCRGTGAKIEGGGLTESVDFRKPITSFPVLHMLNMKVAHMIRSVESPDQALIWVQVSRPGDVTATPPIPFIFG